MGERPPRFHRRPKDPGNGDGLDASAASALAYDAKEVNEKTQQRKRYEISPLEQQQQQQWHGPNQTANSSSTGHDDGLDAPTAPTLASDAKEGSKTKPRRTRYADLTDEQLRQVIREHQRQELLNMKEKQQSNNNEDQTSSSFGISCVEEMDDSDSYEDNYYNDHDDYDDYDGYDGYDDYDDDCPPDWYCDGGLGPYKIIHDDPFTFTTDSFPPPSPTQPIVPPMPMPSTQPVPPTLPVPPKPLPPTPIMPMPLPQTTRPLATPPPTTPPLTTPQLASAPPMALPRTMLQLTKRPPTMLMPLMEYEEQVHSAIIIQSYCRGTMARELLVAHAQVAEMQRKRVFLS
jgi:hypothetical protein